MKIIRKDTADSTNEVAKVLVAEGAESWTVVVAEKQVEGKGRFGRRWFSPRGGLYVSVAILEDLERLPVVSLSTGLAVALTLEEEGVEAQLKWPNDVLVEGRKIAGVLVEGLTRPPAYWGIVGVGVNSNSRLEDYPKELREEVTTLRSELGHRVDNASLLETLLASLKEVYPGRGDEPTAVSRYRERCAILGKDIAVQTVDGMVRGIALDINPSGFLVVETSDGEVEVAEGTILPDS